MALILDKQHKTLILDDSGNTISNNLTNVNYTDQFGSVWDNPYLVVDYVHINKFGKNAKIYTSIFKDRNSRTNKNLPLIEKYYNVQEYEYDNYFSLENMEKSNVFAQSYLYIQKIHLPGWKSDE